MFYAVEMAFNFQAQMEYVPPGISVSTMRHSHRQRMERNPKTIDFFFLIF
jgi:hypothetical protein